MRSPTGASGGAGGGSGGAILLEGSGATATGTVNGGAGGHAGQAGGAGGTSGTPGGGNGITDGSGTKSGSGGGGGYGYLKANAGAAPAYACLTALSPVPACNAAHTSCLCVADSDCPSGKCSNVGGQCTGACTGTTGAGTYDVADCQTLTSF